MPPETTEEILSNIKASLASGDHITFAFQGGEPTIAGLDYFRHFTSIVDTWTGIDVHYALQTNATLLDDEWCVFLKKYNFLLGISWDILADCRREKYIQAHLSQSMCQGQPTQDEQDSLCRCRKVPWL